MMPMLQRMLRFFTTSINYYDGASFGVIVDCRLTEKRMVNQTQTGLDLETLDTKRFVLF
jgi:hypothetical protein